MYLFFNILKGHPILKDLNSYDNQNNYKDLIISKGKKSRIRYEI